MERLGCQMSKHQGQLLLEANGRNNLRQTANQIRVLNTELFQITTKTENEKKTDPEILTNRFINNLQRDKYPLNQDELLLIEKELQVEQKQNIVFRNTVKLKNRCEHQKEAFDKFLCKEKHR